MEYEDPVTLDPGHSRKRKRDPCNWRKNIIKTSRRSGTGKIPSIACNHNGSVGKCQAHQLTSADISTLHRVFYQHGDRKGQDAFILKNISGSQPLRLRPRNNNSQRRRVVLKYQLPVGDAGSVLDICAKTFLSILNISKTRVDNVLNHWKTNKEVRKDNRGGARFDPVKQKLRERITKHILTYKCKASHYGRSKTPHRKYLPGHYTIRGMYSEFLASTGLSCKYSFYYYVFVSDFNLGFGSPAKDVCSDCVRLKQLISTETDIDKKKIHVSKLLLHRTRARRFYKLLNEFDAEDPTTRTIVFDLMQNQELPRTPIGEAYYARQLWQYFFGIVNHHGEKSKQSKEDVYFYTWGEYQAGRGVNVLGSALHDYLCKYVPNNVKNLRLFSDSCGGQNKNYAMMSMLSAFSLERGIKIEYYFPVRGHSYLPADRAFGRAELLIRKHDTLLTPADYFSRFEQVGTIKVLGKDFQFKDWKKYQHQKLKSKSEFLISEAKVLEITGKKVGIKKTYFGNFCQHSVLKKGAKWLPCSVNLLPMESHVTDAKKGDVKKLLTVIGIDETHPAMDYYKTALA